MEGIWLSIDLFPRRSG